MRLSWVLNAISEEGAEGDPPATHTHTHEGCTDRAERLKMLALKTRVTSHKPRRRAAPRNWKRQGTASPPEPLGGEQALLRPGLQTSGLQNCERTDFC